MFQVASPDLIYPTAVEITPPGSSQKQEFTADFIYLPKTEYDAILKKAADANDDGVWIKAVMKGWNDISDADGNPMKFTGDNLDMLLDIPYWTNAVASTYFNFYGALPVKN